MTKYWNTLTELYPYQLGFSGRMIAASSAWMFLALSVLAFYTGEYIHMVGWVCLTSICSTTLIFADEAE